MEPVRRFRETEERPSITYVAEVQKLPNTGTWVPACGGSETPFYTRTRRRLLYCWNQKTGKHAYLDLGTDIILTDEEAREAIAC